VGSHVTKNRGERADLQRIVCRNGEVMLRRRIVGQPNVTARLARDFVTDTPKRFRALRTGLGDDRLGTGGKATVGGLALQRR